MSKAFTKEDVDPPERSGRVRSASGLPPGATNYITPQGASRLREELSKLQREPNTGQNNERVAQLESILRSATVVEPPDELDGRVAFGARITVRDSGSKLKSYRILGVDELDLDPDAVSWISPIGRILLAAKVGERVTLPEIGMVRVAKVEYPGE